MKKKPLATGLLACALALQTSACGTLIFPERVDEEHSRRADPNVLILDAVGLIFFIVPGLVAYIVDFSTGAIYLPEGVDEGEGPFFED